MDRFHKLSILALLLLSVSLAWEGFATSSPTRNTTVEPGQSGYCNYSIYMDGTTPVAHPTNGGTNVVGTAGQKIPAFLSGNSLIASNYTLCFENGGTYDLTGNLTVTDKTYFTINGNDATFQNGYIILSGTSWNGACCNTIENAFFTGASGVRLQGAGSFAHLESLSFSACTVGIDLQNTQQWIEGTWITNFYETGCGTGILFETFVGPGTNSYVSTHIDHAFFRMTGANNIGISVQNN